MEALSTTLLAISDPTRRAIVDRLARGPARITDIAEPFAMSLAAASKHIKTLEHAGLIRREVRGRTHLCRLAPGPLASAHQWLSFYEDFWTDRLDALERLLREADAHESPMPEIMPKEGDDE